MNKKIILLIGCPSSGKTTLINYLKKVGHRCYPEISREVTIKAKAKGIDQLFLKNPILFSEMLLDGRIEQYNNAKLENKLVFIDRGIPDVLAYMDYIGVNYSEKFEHVSKKFKYDLVFLLPPWKEIYTRDSERYETYEEALKIHEHLVAAYKKYGYNLIEVPKTSVEERYLFIEKHLK